MSLPNCKILGVFTGETKTLVDERGTWTSSIQRDPAEGSVRLETRGFVGDKATQPYHGSPELAVCLHAQTHYDFWHASLGMDLGPGGVGENLTLDTWDDSLLCVGDVLQIGTARLQVSAPRAPCENQARFIGRADWVKRTLEALRTGLYARVLVPGEIQAGDRVTLEARLNPGLTIQGLNRLYYFNFDPDLAQRFVGSEGLMDWWKERLRDKIGAYESG